MEQSNEIFISVVIPAFNEEKNVSILHEKLLKVLKSFNRPFEIIFINDGSTDTTESELEKLRPVKIITLRRNFGQTAALDAGFKAAQGTLIVSSDADLQNDPEDIPALIKKLGEGYDLVSGWRKDRHDPQSKKIISRGANWLRKYIVSDEIHDSGCTLKVYKRECFQDLDLAGEMHRFIPAILRWRGFKVGELPVKHHERIYGETKYNWRRVVKGFLDMLGLWFWHRYSNRPIHLFGAAGLGLTTLGALALLTLLVLRLLGVIYLADKIWPLLSVLCILAGLQLFVSGLLADIAVKSYHKQAGQRPYQIRSVEEKK